MKFIVSVAKRSSVPIATPLRPLLKRKSTMLLTGYSQ